MIAWRWREEERSKDLQSSEKNQKSKEPRLMRCGSIKHRCATEQYRHLKRKGRAAIIPQSKPEPAHTVVPGHIRAMHDEIENPVGENGRGHDQSIAPAPPLRD